MSTAVDTNIILDLLSPGSDQGDDAESSLRDWSRRGALVISEVVFAEISPSFNGTEEVNEFLRLTGMRLMPSSAEVLFSTGVAWRDYLGQRPRALACPRCGITNDVKCAECGGAIRTRQHLLTDLLVGAHASAYADRLLTRDRGYYRRYFPKLTVVDPSV